MTLDPRIKLYLGKYAGEMSPDKKVRLKEIKNKALFKGDLHSYVT